MQPLLDPRDVEAGERDVVGVDDCELVVDSGERGGQVVGASLLDRTAAEIAEVGGHSHRRPVLAELVQRKVEPGHSNQSKPAARGRCLELEQERVLLRGASNWGEVAEQLEFKCSFGPAFEDVDKHLDLVCPKEHRPSHPAGRTTRLASGRQAQNPKPLVAVTAVVVAVLIAIILVARHRPPARDALIINR